MPIATELDLYGINLLSGTTSAAAVKRAQDAGYLVMLWGVETADENAKALLKHPDFIQTDHPSSLSDLLAGRERRPQRPIPVLK